MATASLFISSVQKELAQERRAIRITGSTAIRRSGISFTSQRRI